MKYSKLDHQLSLNELPIAFNDCKSNGGRIPDNALLGNWMRANDPIAFSVSYNETKREIEYREGASK